MSPGDASLPQLHCRSISAPRSLDWTLWDEARDWHPLRDAVDGTTPLLETRVSVLRDPGCLFVLFDAADDHSVATFEGRDALLYQEDVVEVFIAPGDVHRYYEFEVSPAGCLFDAVIDSPNLERRGMLADVAWNAPGLECLVRRTGTPPRWHWQTILGIPLVAFEREAFEPKRLEPRDIGVGEPAESWRANFFRIDRHPRGDSYQAWSPTCASPADFHVPEKFGFLRG